MHQSQRRTGLILLVVLGMLSLFSMLAITYVVFSSQSRNASLTMARKEYRGTPPTRLLDEAAHQLLRGSSDFNSVMWRQGLLGDYYGSGLAAGVTGVNDSWITTEARTTLRDDPQRQNRVTWSFPTPVVINAGDLEAPKLLNGMFLKIPLQWNNALPRQHDVFNGRILSFGGGPLQGKSFRIVRYLGEMPESPSTPPTPPALIVQQSLQYSVTIDLTTVLDDMVTVGTTTAPLRTWISTSSANNGAALCYGNPGSPLSNPFPLLINSAPRNAMGSGIGVDGDYFDPGSQRTVQTVGASSPNISFPPGTPMPNGATDPYASIATALLQNYSYAKKGNASFAPIGDLDEAYDAADATDFHLGYRYPGATSGDLIIPSFHRPAVINYIYSTAVDAKSGGLPAFTLGDVFATIELLQRACGRPLSFRITDGVPPPNTTVLAQQNPAFTGSNYGEFSGGVARTPQLDIAYNNNWNMATSEHEKFEAWVRWLQRGPWDVDADGDAIPDSNWVDLNLPLMTSAEGRLLKVMAAYYVEDLGGRLNLNTSGNIAQAQVGFNTMVASGPNRYAVLSGGQLPQGLGFGTSDINLRHLFNSDAEYQRFIAERNGAVQSTLPAAFTSFGPGSTGDDLVSRLRQRNIKYPPFTQIAARDVNHNQNQMPGMPLSIFGRTGIGIDLFGNPINYDVGQMNQIVDDPYESRVLSTSHSDRLISIPEWERVERMFDPDRSTLPNRLERLMLTGSNILTGQDRIRAVTPRSSSSITASFPGIYQHSEIDPVNSPPPPAAPVYRSIPRRVTSFSELVEALVQQKSFYGGSGPHFDSTALAQLFPLEFKHNLPLDINRPFGNGIDDDGDLLIDEAGESAGHGFDDDGNNGVDDPGEIASNPGRHQRAFYTGGPYNNILEDYTLSGGSFDPFFEDTGNRSNYELRNFGGNQGRQLLARHLYCLAQLILPDDYIFPNQPNATAYGYGSPERARILAQWAVNVVDYRDMDSNNTRFPYDVDPLNNTTGPYWDPNASGSNGVVWGNERADVLITETLAFHDLRISRKQNPPPGTNEWQQLRIPEGSLFMEFMATASSDSGSGLLPGVARGTNNALYRVNGNTAELALSSITPADNNGEQFPVFRVLLLDPHTPGSSVTDAYVDPNQRFNLQYQFANAAGLQWDASGTNPVPDVNRVMWFANLAPTNGNLALPGTAGMTPEKVYYNRGSNVFLQGGQYLTVGPRADTYVGQRNAPNTPPLHRPNPHRIELQNNWTQLWTEENYPGLWLPGNKPSNLNANDPVPAPSNYIGTSVSMLAQADLPAAWTTYAGPPNRPLIGINISEPTPNAYYPEPTERLNGSGNAANTNSDTVTGAPGFGSMAPDAYVDLEANPNANSPHDPLDISATGLLGNSGWATQPAPNERPNVETRENWSTAVLQRLATPDLPWHATLNPYITIDWMPIDLTVFSGEESITADGTVSLASRQKTGVVVATTDPANIAAATIPTVAGRTHYSYHAEPPPQTNLLASTTAEPGYFDYRMPMEYIDTPNNNTDVPQPRLTGFQNVGEFVTLGYLNSRYGLRGLNGENTHTNYQNSVVYYNGGGGTPLAPSAPANMNRDFVSSHELINVPLSSPGQMMQEFTATAPGGSAAPFAHVLDFEMQTQASTTKSAAALLELVDVRDPWPDSATNLPPNEVVAPSAAAFSNGDILNNVMAIYRAPFNRLPTYVEPGKVNLNTASEEAVLRGLMWNTMLPSATRNAGPIPYQNELAASRAGLSASSSLTAPNPNLDKNLPTQFAGVFKSPFSDNVPGFATGNASMTGILRQQSSGSTRVFYPDTTAPYNPIAQNYPVTRLSNLTTTNSNVYAVRVVLGYFEFDPVAGLGREYGEDEGKVKRHKGFYLIDRSIPVAYQEGEDLNTDKCILLRRMVE